MNTSRRQKKKTWWSTLREDLHARGVSWSEAEELTADRVQWRHLLAAHCPEKRPEKQNAQ